MVASRSPRFVEAPLKLDVAGADLLAALTRCLAPDSFSAASRSLYRQWGDEHHSLASATLRAGFDLYLQALDLPAGCEVLLSAITHPDMVDVVRHLGLVPVPVDIVAATMAPSPEALRRAVTPRARVMVVAHLFGGHFDLTEVLALCRAHGLRLVEDCAQTFGSGYRGHPEADATLFSFGPLKTRTALQGAVMSIRDPALRSRMAESRPPTRASRGAASPRVS